MPTHSTPSHATHITPQHVQIRRRHGAPGSAGPSSLSKSFSLGPADDDMSDSSIGTPTRGRVAVLTTSEQGNMGLHGQLSPRVRAALSRGSPGGGPSNAPGSEPRNTRSRSRLSEVMRPQNGGAHDEDDDDLMSEPESWTMLDSMRIWRQDAMTHHLYETAGFWANKILDWTGESGYLALADATRRCQRRLLACPGVLPHAPFCSRRAPPHRAPSSTQGPITRQGQAEGHHPRRR